MGRTEITHNRRWPEAAPTLSVLVPFLRDDPTGLLTALAREGPLEERVELITLDDGTGDDLLAARVAAAVHELPLPAAFLRLRENDGRAKGRNRLARHARGRFLLFLDSDMLPDGDRFLRTYLELIAAEQPEVAFGGFSLLQAPLRPEHALHRAMTLKSDCSPVEVRRREPEKHVYTSNLLVRRDVFLADPFDEAFRGWGWEDVEWALRVSQHHPIRHVDNTATHLGLEPAASIAAKYEEAAPNFARLVQAHRQAISHYPSYRAALLLRRLPLLRLWRPAFKAVALQSGAPLPLRDLAMRLYRAALYAEAI
jgi:glycosyltransferase involved in cell wall biosynthesis